MNKKWVAIVVLMLLSALICAGPALAEVPPDAVGHDAEEAIVKLLDLGVISGFPDGTIRPDHLITRAEFSVIAVRALELESEAERAMGATDFHDAAAGAWYTGYVNVATDHGIIQGYPDGSFGPNRNLTNNEAITILVRLLGLGPEVEQSGTWPSNYVSKANELGLLRNLTLAGGASATRGDVFQMAGRALDILWDPEESTQPSGRTPDFSFASDVRFSGITFFVGEDSFRVPENRRYSRTRLIERSELDTLGVELVIRHPETREEYYLPVIIRITDEEDEVMGEWETSFQLTLGESEWTGAVDLPGYEFADWEDGAYRVSFHLNHFNFGRQTFTVYTDYSAETAFIKEATVESVLAFGDVAGDPTTDNLEFGTSFSRFEHDIFGWWLEMTYAAPEEDIYLPITVQLYRDNALRHSYDRHRHLEAGTTEFYDNGIIWYSDWRTGEPRTWEAGNFRYVLYAYYDFPQTERILLGEVSFRIR